MHLQRANLGRRVLWQGVLFALALVFMPAPVFAAASVAVTCDGKALNQHVCTMYVEVATTVGLVVTNAKVSQPISWPKVNGLTLSGTGWQPVPGGTSYNFFLTPARVGDFTVPAFDIRTDDGQTLHVGPIKFHAVPHG